MDHFNYHNGVLHAEDLSLEELAQRHGTPLYVYSRATLERHWHAFDRALGDHPHLVCYAVKANSSLAVLNLLARLGSGFDIVSVGELERVVRAGGDPGKVVFSGVGKRTDEMRRALELGIRCFNVESAAELERLNAEAGALGVTAPVSLRVNPDVDAQTHPYISTGLKENKFGVDVADALDLYRRAAALPHLNIIGIDCHIGSQLTRLEPFVDALRRVLHLARTLEGEGIRLHHLDLGGGLGIRYRDEHPPLPEAYARAMLEVLRDTHYEILVEPGRAIAGNAGVLLTRVEYLKPTRHKHFAIVDAAMNDLIRPSLYSAWMDIVPVRPRGGEGIPYDVVGPVCETGDFLGKERTLDLVAADLLAVRSAGAYGFTMSSNYNTRPRPAEVMVDGDRDWLIHRRQTLDELLAGETLLPG
ncbi:diaminopimelate decarboxylase [Ectothiorhodospira lacustris]|uniref:diaminopimelate decarboxylase n=1 Tax=Ectothiorhodospira lacustris TaxID=2899127 RepID=UPI001EE80E20|nr:diaminopimelate decarboxylase [Ectothiorhodospira lacustris]MCG5509226.1 diaminopimelate decarboxylase [Ectothiorhodospira lacustris]MCG5521016.1 diaminopimelate decarboxylase [Ectothiorhodospira lacustris]